MFVKMSGKVRYITYTALLLAMTVAVQALRTIIPAMSAVVIFGPFNLSILIIGSLVNLILIISAWKVGLWSGFTISLLSTLIAFLQGHLPIPHMIPVVTIGNAVIVAVVWLLRNKNLYLAVIAGSAAKFLALWAMVSWIIIPILTPNENMQKIIKALSVNFSWPQLLTALIGGVIACLIWPRLKKGSAVQPEIQK